MDKISSFQKNHDALAVGLHAQTDKNAITTFDLRFKKPNAGDYITPKALHTIEHLLATVLRNSREKENIVYFGPMGCRTGCYLLLYQMDYEAALPVVKQCLEECLNADKVYGATRKECGNYLEHDLEGAKKEIREYLAVL